jgi:hypothetical protein
MNSEARFAIYVGCGALIHALTIRPVFDWSSAWTWAMLLAWPLALFVWLAKWGLIAVAIPAFIAMSIADWEWFNG